MKKVLKVAAGLFLALTMITSAVGVPVCASTVPNGGEACMLVDYSSGPLNFGSNSDPPFAFTDEVKKGENAGSHMWPTGTTATGRYTLDAAPKDLSGYRYINFWAKAGETPATPFSVMLLRGSALGSGYYTSPKISLTTNEWTLITIPLVSDSADFTYTGSDDDKFAQITLIYFSTGKSTIKLNAPIYFDSVWVSKSAPATDENILPIMDYGNEAEVEAAKYRSKTSYGRYEPGVSRKGSGGSYKFSYVTVDSPPKTLGTSRYDLLDSKEYMKTNWDSHNYVNLWAKTDKPGGVNFKLNVFTTTSTKDPYFTYTAALENDSWTLLRIPKDAFEKQSGATDEDWANIRSINLNVTRSDLQEDGEDLYALYFDELYLSMEKETIEAADRTVADFGVGENSDNFEPGDNRERTEISTEVVLPGSTTSMKWKSGNTGTAAAGNNRFIVTRKDWSDYTHLNMWVYSPYAADDVFQIVLMKGASLSDGTKRYQVKLNFKGWKLISVPFDSFNNIADDTMNWENIHKIYFDTKKEDRELYFDSIWLSQNESEDKSQLLSEVDVKGVTAEYAPGEKLNITADVFDKKENSVMLVAAEYDDKRGIIQVSPQVGTLVDNTVQLSAEFTASSDSAYIKVFVFGRESLSPLCRTISARAKTEE